MENPKASEETKKQLIEFLVNGPAVPDLRLEAIQALLRDPRTASKPLKVSWQSEVRKKVESLVKALVKNRFGRKLLDMLYETFQLVGYIGAIAFLDHLLERWLGPEPKLFDYLKISYILDTGHLLVIGRFFLELVKNLVEGVKDVVASIKKQPTG